MNQNSNKTVWKMLTGVKGAIDSKKNIVILKQS